MSSGAVLDIVGKEEPLTEDLAKRLGFINLVAMGEWQRRRETVTVDKLLVDVCNMKQMILDTKLHVERVDRDASSCMPIG